MEHILLIGEHSEGQLDDEVLLQSLNRELLLSDLIDQLPRHPAEVEFTSVVFNNGVRKVANVLVRILILESAFFEMGVGIGILVEEDVTLQDISSNLEHIVLFDLTDKLTRVVVLVIEHTSYHLLFIIVAGGHFFEGSDNLPLDFSIDHLEDFLHSMDGEINNALVVMEINHREKVLLLEHEVGRVDGKSKEVDIGESVIQSNLLKIGVIEDTMSEVRREV